MMHAVKEDNIYENSYWGHFKEKCKDILLQVKAKLISPHFWLYVFLAQILSLIICGTGVVNNKLFDSYKVNIPTTQTIINYILLALIYTPIWFYYVKDRKIIFNLIKKNWWKYLLITFADVEANYLITKAYSLTLVTTIQVIDAFILPMALILSRIILKTHYRKNHIVGVVACLLGCGSLVGADYLIKGDSGTHRLIGDVLCLISCVCYGFSNVGQEYLVKNYSKLEYLATTGIFGCIISAIQFAIFERNEISSVDFSIKEIIGLIFAINLLLFMLYSLFPHVIELTSAAFININLLTADFYAVIIGIVAYKYELHPLYFVGFVLILFGTVAYCIREPIRKSTTKVEHVDEALDKMTSTGNNELNSNKPIKFLEQNAKETIVV